MTDPVYYSKEEPSVKCFQTHSSEYYQDEGGNLIMKGEEQLVVKRRGNRDLMDYERDLNRVRKLRIL